jgi:hypothetical protein
MAPNAHRHEFSMFDFIWEEIKAISENPLKSRRYAPYIMHMIERVTARTFHCEKEHHPLRIKNDLNALVEDRKAAVGQEGSSPPRAIRSSGSKETSLCPLFKKFSACFLECASPNTPLM